MQVFLPESLKCRPTLRQKVIRAGLYFICVFFFAVPYLVDLVYCEDLSAPPLLLARLVDGEEVDASEVSVGPFSSNDQATSGDSALSVLVAYSQPICQTQAIGYLQHLSLASLTSRPPPVL